MNAGTYLVCWLQDGGSLHLDPSQEPRLDAGVEAYHDGIRDQMLYLDDVAGMEIRILASQVTGWYVSTPEERRARANHQKALDDEDREIRAELGIFEEP